MPGFLGSAALPLDAVLPMLDDFIGVQKYSILLDDVLSGQKKIMFFIERIMEN